MRQVFSSGSSGETCALARATAAAAAARAAAASASEFCANAAGPKRLAATRQLAGSIQIFLISILPCSAPNPIGFFALLLVGAYRAVCPKGPGGVVGQLLSRLRSLLGASDSLHRSVKSSRPGLYRCVLAISSWLCLKSLISA